ncbi:MAG: CBS domain-containing protein [Bacteroidota bacterium]
MIAGNLLSHNIIPLRTSDTGAEALGIMNDFYVRHLPIVNDKQLLGLISEDDILEHDIEEAVGSYRLSMTKPYVKDTDHLYDVLKILSEYQLTIVPVIDVENNYKGLISQDDLVRYFANTGSFTEPGSIIVIGMHRRDYSLAEISRIVESEDAAILSTFITSNLQNDRIDVTIKINRQDFKLHRIIASFERFEYEVKASFQEADYFDGLQERYDSLMNYLNV